MRPETYQKWQLKLFPEQYAAAAPAPAVEAPQRTRWFEKKQTKKKRKSPPAVKTDLVSAAGSGGGGRQKKRCRSALNELMSSAPPTKRALFSSPATTTAAKRTRAASAAALESSLSGKAPAPERYFGSPVKRPRWPLLPGDADATDVAGCSSWGVYHPRAPLADAAAAVNRSNVDSPPPSPCALEISQFSPKNISTPVKRKRDDTNEDSDDGDSSFHHTPGQAHIKPWGES